jgi:uncharacterized protein (DUF488 family)
MPKAGKLYTIGLNKGNIGPTFNKLKALGLTRVIDIRLYPSFVNELKSNFDYRRLPEFAPTRDILICYRSLRDWPMYERDFQRLMVFRKPLESKQASDFDDAVLICAERSSVECHRRLVAEMIHDKFGHEVVHL